MAKGPTKPGSNGTAAPPRRPKVSDQPAITIRASIGNKIIAHTVTRAAPLERLAQKWSYILRARSRWADNDGLRETVGAQVLDDLEGIGVPRPFVQQMATANGIEVELHEWNAQDADATRIQEAASEVPWEYLISTGTRTEGRFRPLLISRLFQNGMSGVKPSPPRTVLLVESLPGRLEGTYEFDDEEERICAAVGVIGKRGWRMKIVKTPQVSELVEITRKNWEAIHVTGIDTHQAAWLVEDFYEAFKDKPEIWNEIIKSSDRLQDGMILRDKHESERPIAYDRLAKMLVGGSAPPRIVTLNLYYSGARTARELVKDGAHAALGFLDEIDDELAERFFQAFYWEWCHPASKVLSIPEAFRLAWYKMSGSGLHGTSIVIWMGRSVLAADISGPSLAANKKKVQK